jgi:hypothetical protein
MQYTLKYIEQSGTKLDESECEWNDKNNDQ